jgi:hypothetical protein
MLTRQSTATRGRILTVIYLAVAVVFVQAAQLHLHTYSFGHDSGHQAGILGHAHHNTAHSAHAALDLSGPGHADEILSGIDITPAGLLKHLLSGLVLVALLMAVSMLLAPPLLTTTSRHSTRAFHPVTGWHAYRPPLRAPPL